MKYSYVVVSILLVVSGLAITRHVLRTDTSPTSRSMPEISPKTRPLPENPNIYSVMIRLPQTGATGSGFLLRADTNVFLVTARHCLLRTADFGLLGTNAVITFFSPTNSDSSEMEVDLGILMAINEVKYHTNHDVVAVRLGVIPDRKTGRGSWWTSIRHKPSNFQFMSVRGVEGTKRFEDILVGNDVFVFGFPRSLGFDNVPQIDHEQSLVKRGIVSQKNYRSRRIIIDGAVFPGNSGGPVVEVEYIAGIRTFTLCGIVTEFVPFDKYGHLLNSGYAVVEPLDTVFELIGHK